MIVSVVIDMLRTNLRQLGWAYYLFADRCRTDNWKCIVEEKYTKWELSNQDVSDLDSAQHAWDYHFSSAFSDVKNNIDIIPETVFDDINRYGPLTVDKLLSERCIPLEKCLNGIFEKYQKEEKIECIIVYPKVPRSLLILAEERGIPLFVLEVSPMRWPVYTGGAYLTHYDQLSTDPGECAKMYSQFLTEVKERKIPLLTREQILALFLMPDYLKYIKYLNAPEDNEALLVGTSSMAPSDRPIHWNETQRLAQELRSRFGDDFRFRPDPRDPLEAQFHIDEAQFSEENPNIISLLRSKRMVCCGSNMLFEAMLWGRIVYCDTEGHGLYFICNHTDNWADLLTPIEFLNFFSLVYISPMSITSTDEYIRWRLTEPTLEARFYKHLNYYLQQLGLSYSELLNMPPQKFIDKIVAAKGQSPEAVRPVDWSSCERIWDTVRQETGFSIGPKAQKAAAEVDLRSHIQDTQEQLTQTQQENRRLSEIIVNLSDTISQTQQENQRLNERIANLSDTMSQAQQENQALICDNNRLRNHIEHCLDELSQLQERNRSFQAAYVAIAESRSWKLTKPIRLLLDYLKTLLHR